MVITYGIDQDHERDWVFDRPHGTEKWLIMCFTTPFLIHTAAGCEIGVPGDCLIVDPGTPQFHGSAPDAPEAFRNDWLYADGDWLGERVAELELPVNERMSTGNPMLIRPYMESIRREVRHAAPFSGSFLRHLVEGILLEIARARKLAAVATTADARSRDAMVAVRQRVHDRLEYPWTVPEMAELAGLRRNRFTIVYRQCFGCSPHADLQEARLRAASHHLLTGDARITDIAAACGFASVYYFSRAFHERYGCPPSQFSRGRR